MTNIDEIVKALRTCADKQENCESCHTGQSDCPFGETCVDCTERMNRAAADALMELCEKVIELTAERDALLKSFAVTSQPIEVIQPKGVVE